MKFDESKLELDSEGNPILPPVRTFLVRRPTPGFMTSVATFAEEGVEAHRYYVDSTGALCFEQVVWVASQGSLMLLLPKAMAPGSWWDVTETTFFDSRVKVN